MDKCPRCWIPWPPLCKTHGEVDEGLVVDEVLGGMDNGQYIYTVFVYIEMLWDIDMSIYFILFLHPYICIYTYPMMYPLVVSFGPANG